MKRAGRLVVTGMLAGVILFFGIRSGQSQQSRQQRGKQAASGPPSAQAREARKRLTREDWVARPWMVRAPAFAIADNLYYVGNIQFASHLVVGEKGIVLIDTPYKEHAYLLTESIRSVGVDPADITLILHTHYHYDHVGATRRIQELSDAAVAMGSEDIELLRTKSPGYMEPFEVDRPLKHGDTIDLGNTVIRCHHTPGHTPGTMSYTFDVKIGGKRYTAGLFGGPGTNVFTMKGLYYPGAEEQFPRSLEYLSGLDVDIWLGAHPFQNRTLEKYERVQKGEKPNPFIDPEGWSRFLGNLKAQYQRIMADPPAWVR